jgi:hypothetical protein
MFNGLVFSLVEKYYVSPSLNNSAKIDIKRETQKALIINNNNNYKYDMFGRIQNIKPCGKCGNIK